MGMTNGVDACVAESAPTPVRVQTQTTTTPDGAAGSYSTEKEQKQEQETQHVSHGSPGHRPSALTRTYTDSYQGPTFSELMRCLTPQYRQFPDQLRKHSVQVPAPASVTASVAASGAAPLRGSRSQGSGRNGTKKSTGVTRKAII